MAVYIIHSLDLGTVASRELDRGKETATSQFVGVGADGQQVDKSPEKCIVTQVLAGLRLGREIFSNWGIELANDARDAQLA